MLISHVYSLLPAGAYAFADHGRTPFIYTQNRTTRTMSQAPLTERAQQIIAKDWLVDGDNPECVR